MTFGRVSALICAALAAPFPPLAFAQDAKSLWEQDTLTGDWNGVRSRLEDAGVTFRVQEKARFGEIWPAGCDKGLCMMA